jgi:nucleoside-diphosphate-sugar epimerase
MKILITGNLGYVGSELTRFILKENKKIEIIGCDINLYPNTYVKKINYKIKKQFIKDYRYLDDNDLEGVYAIIHLAAMSNDPIGKLITTETHKINYVGVKKIIKLAKRNKVKKFIFASSCSVYGSAGSFIKSEKDSTKPLTAYAKSKILSEEFLRKSKGIQSYSLRFGTACGYSNQLRLDLVLNEFVFTALKYKKIKILSNGLPFRPMIHVTDMSKAIFACLKDFKKNNYNMFNVGISNFQVIEMAKKVAKFCKCKISVNPKASHDKRSYKVSFKKFNDFAKTYKPSINIEKIIQDLAKNYKKNKILSLKNYSNSKFIRLATIRKLIKKNQLSL